MPMKMSKEDGEDCRGGSWIEDGSHVVTMFNTFTSRGWLYSLIFPKALFLQ